MSENLPTAAVEKIHSMAEDVSYIKATVDGHISDKNIHLSVMSAIKAIGAFLGMCVAYIALKGQ